MEMEARMKSMGRVPMKRDGVDGKEYIDETCTGSCFCSKE
jgi:hypothetical protein